MRPIHLARMEKTRPVLVLTRDAVRSRLRRVTIAIHAAFDLDRV